MKYLIIFLFLISFVAKSQIASTQYKYGSSIVCIPDVIYDVYVIAGQSIGAGYGKQSELTGNYLTRFNTCVDKPNASMFLKDRQYLTNISKSFTNMYCCPSSGHSNDFSVEMPLSLNYTNNTSRVIFVKFCKDATKLYKDSTVTDWNISSVNEYYDSLKLTINSFKTYMSINGYRYKFKGFIWLQGQGDANVQYMANKYQTNLTNLVNDFRTFIGKSDLPVYSMYIYPSQTYATTVNTAINSVSNSIANFKKVNYRYLEFKSDSVHLTGNGVFMLSDSITTYINQIAY